MSIIRINTQGSFKIVMAKFLIRFKNFKNRAAKKWLNLQQKKVESNCK